jgi:hypothetical protein
MRLGAVRRSLRRLTGLSVDTMDYLHQIQWPAMMVTIVAAWLIASQSTHRREIGF